MAEAEREVTKEEFEAIAAKLGPAVESLTDGEREVFASILERAGRADGEVSGFDYSIKGDFAIKGGYDPGVAWENPLSAQLATAAGMALPDTNWKQKWEL